ncbi:unnamed protein product [Tuber melanosporum]|jgi:hypothetical protein|uniref:(Perigord truffle) hypothetical protein n=1 Tax=Tuber melanosporum (strain Mel28) TaxID=656061 RepID=D5G9I3_TUBMM|nr:uncharacterized protein GSTUM_00003338001 [Tuber melanosporum]CAZ81176.1 unnamed protein product [Tuber melanosporum]
MFQISEIYFEACCRTICGIRPAFELCDLAFSPGGADTLLPEKLVKEKVWESTYGRNGRARKLQQYSDCRF